MVDKGKIEEMKEYKIPDEVMKIHEEYLAALQLRDLYVTRTFGFKKAKKCSIEAVSKRREFWHKVKQLYPELLEKSLVLGEKENGYVVREVEEKES